VIKLRQLCVQFANTAAQVGTTIVKELFYPQQRKSIQNISQLVGGLAGGEKVRHCLYPCLQISEQKLNRVATNAFSFLTWVRFLFLPLQLSTH
jgi:hypothetical protein